MKSPPFCHTFSVLFDHGVSTLVMLRQIQTHRFLFGFDAHADRFIHEETYDPGDNRAVYHGDARGLKLDPKLCGITCQKSFRAGRIDGLAGEDPGGDGAPEPADPVDTESVQRIIIAELGLDHAHREVAKYTDQDPDPKGCPDIDKPGGRRNGDQTRDGTGNGPEHRGFAIKGPFERGPG